MGLGIGLVGLPNVGKSTTFNALTKAQNAESANYPFCTIEPNKAVVPVPDKRLDELAKIVNPEKIQYSTLDFVDIAGPAFVEHAWAENPHGASGAGVRMMIRLIEKLVRTTQDH